MTEKKKSVKKTVKKAVSKKSENVEPKKKTKVLKATTAGYYTPEIGARICEIVATSDIGTQTLCDTHPEMPPIKTLYEWRYRNDDFNEAFKKAKLYQAEYMAESLDCIANEKLFYYDSEGNKRVDTGFTNDKRLRIDTRKWIAAKLLPKAYGDKKELEQAQTENEELKQQLRELRQKLQDENQSEY